MNRTQLRKPIPLILLTIFLGSLFWTVSPTRHALAGTINVNTNIDELNNNGNCSLREAIAAANSDTSVDACPAGSGTDTINLPPGYIFTGISGAAEDGNLTGDYDIFTSMIFKGTGTIIDGDGLDGIWLGSEQKRDIREAKNPDYMLVSGCRSPRRPPLSGWVRRVKS